jgi:hypothetical protein
MISVRIARQKNYQTHLKILGNRVSKVDDTHVETTMASYLFAYHHRVGAENNVFNDIAEIKFLPRAEAGTKFSVIARCDGNDQTLAKVDDLVQ